MSAVWKVKSELYNRIRLFEVFVKQIFQNPEHVFGNPVPNDPPEQSQANNPIPTRTIPNRPEQSLPNMFGIVRAFCRKLIMK